MTTTPSGILNQLGKKQVLKLNEVIPPILKAIALTLPTDAIALNSINPKSDRSQFYQFHKRSRVRAFGISQSG